jgi:glycosyltransferase involved in cell wall biosynthesis
VARRSRRPTLPRIAAVTETTPPTSPLPGPIVHVDSEAGFSGGEVQVFLLMEGLRARGVQQVLVARKGSESAAHARARGFPVVEAPLRNAFDLRSVWTLRRALAGAAIAHLHTGKAAWLGSLAASSLGCPVVITRRMDRVVKRSLRTRFAYGRTAKAVVAISPAVRQCLIDGGVPKERIELIWEALDEGRIAPRRDREATRIELGAQPSACVVLTLAQLHHRKGIDVLLQALALLQQQGKARGLVAWIGGDGPEGPALRRLCEELGLSQHVRFLGRRQDPGDLLAACDLFALPSRAEGLGVAALEALGAGRPVIASRVGGLASMVKDEVCGLLVPPEDPKALAAALERLCEDAPLRAALGDAGPRRVDEGFRIGQCVERHLDLYRAVLAGR